MNGRMGGPVGGGGNIESKEKGKERLSITIGCITLKCKERINVVFKREKIKKIRGAYVLTVAPKGTVLAPWITKEAICICKAEVERRVGVLQRKSSKRWYVKAAG